MPKDLSSDMFEKFDHIFSFYCLHMIHNQRQFVENLYKMLKPGGQAFLTSLFRNPFFRSWLALSKCEKWAEHIGHFPEFCSEYFTCDEPVKLFEKIFKEAGFAIEFITTVPMYEKFFNAEKFERAVTEVNLPVDSIPEALKKEFIKDNIEMMYKLCNNTYVVENETAVAVVKKPTD